MKTIARHVAGALAAWIAVALYARLGLGEPGEDVVGGLTAVLETSFVFLALVVYAVVEKLSKRVTKE